MHFRIAIALTLVIIVVNVITLGGVGDVLFDFGDAIAVQLFGDTLGHVHGDYYWPIAFWMGLVCPIGTFLIYYLVDRQRAGQRWTKVMYASFAASLLALVIGLSIAFHVGAASVSPKIEVYELAPRE